MSHPDDIYEKEANQIAEHVTYSSASLQSKVPIRPSAIEKINHKSPYGEDVSNIKTSSSEAYAFSEDRLQGIDNIGDRGFPLNISTRSIWSPDLDLILVESEYIVMKKLLNQHRR